MKKHDRFLARRYLYRALRRSVEDKALRPRLICWMVNYWEALVDMEAGFLVPRLQKSELAVASEGDLVWLPARKGKRKRPKHAGGKIQRKMARYLDYAVRSLAKSLADPPPEDAGAKATGIVVRRFSLVGTCGAVLDLARLYANRRWPFRDLWDKVTDGLGDHFETTALLLAVSRREVERALRQMSAVGIADLGHWGADTADPGCYMNRWLESVYTPPVSTEEELLERLVPLAAAPLLDLDAFEHLDGHGAAVRLLKEAVESRRGVRLLFYGRAGTGKTEFSKALARAAGARLYESGDPIPSSSWWEEETSNERDRAASNRNELRMALALLRTQPSAAILVDETEDVLSSEAGSRWENHRFLEEAAVPLIFTANDLSQFDEAMLRRFDLTIRFRVHSPTRRRDVVRRMLENANLAGLQRGELASLAARLADELECSPGIIERAIRNTQLVGGSPRDLFEFAERHERTISTHIARPRLGPPVKAGLSWEAFRHLGEPADDVRRLLAATIGARRRGGTEGTGVAFLAYGPPGCGKTEFCCTVAAEAGAVLYSVGGKEQGPDARLTVRRSVSLEYAIEALTDEPEAVILFDELEDYCAGSKQWLNGLVETTPVPLLFTANSIDALRWAEPFFLDRLTFSLEFEHFPRRRRATIFRGLLGGADGMEPLAEELAADRRLKPRQVRNACRVAGLSGGGAAAARRAVREKTQLLWANDRAEPSPAEKYDFSLIHANPDLAALTEEIVAAGPGRCGILLDGPSGSGKSEYAKQLGKRLDLDPLSKRASHLMSKWVGETEEAIAGAFREARATNSLLIVDEADSFLADRRDAARNWEISMVNEMLSQLENHDLPYVFTTNLADHLDPAVGRRFLFRATFEFLDEPRVVRAWEFFFGGECPAQVRCLLRLVPADFALVHQRAGKLRFLDDRQRIVGDLTAASRDRHRSGGIGF